MGLFLCIFETPGIYLHETNNGVFAEQLFDITEYEAIPEGKRRNISPIYFLQCIDQNKICDPTMVKFKNTDYIKLWSWLKLKINSFILIIVVFLMLLYFLVFLNLDGHFRYKDESRFISADNAFNSTCLEQYYTPQKYNEKFVLFMLVHLTCFSILSIIMDVCNTMKIISLPGLQPLPTGRKNVLLYFWFQTLLKLLLNVNVLCFVLLKFNRMYFTENLSHYWDDALFIVGLLSFSWYFIGVAQIIPKLGVYVILLERMVMSLISFLGISVLFLVMFTSVAFRLFNRHRQVCLDEFSSVYRSYYSIFLTTFNMMSYEEIYQETKEEVSAIVIYGFHNLVVCIMGLFLINFLIALFTRSMEDIGKKEEWIIMAQCSFVCSNIENSFGFIFQVLISQNAKKNIYIQT